MPSPKPHAARKSTHKPTHRLHSKPVEVVHPLWLAKALALSLLAALLCAWLTLCLLFYQGDWQLILHPSPTVVADPRRAQPPLRHHPLRRRRDRPAPPHRLGRFPAAPIARRDHRTLRRPHHPLSPRRLRLPRRHPPHPRPPPRRRPQRLRHRLPRLRPQRRLRPPHRHHHGRGRRRRPHLPHRHPPHPRHSHHPLRRRPRRIPRRHPRPRTIPNSPPSSSHNPDPDPTATALAARSSNLIPVRLLFHQHFDIATPLATLTTPKLLIAGGPQSTPHTRLPQPARHSKSLFQQAASPSFSVTLPPTNYDARLPIHPHPLPRPIPPNSSRPQADGAPSIVTLSDGSGVIGPHAALKE